MDLVTLNDQLVLLHCDAVLLRSTSFLLLNVFLYSVLQFLFCPICCLWSILLLFSLLSFTSPFCFPTFAECWYCLILYCYNTLELVLWQHNWAEQQLWNSTVASDVHQQDQLYAVESTFTLTALLLSFTAKKSFVSHIHAHQLTNLQNDGVGSKMLEMWVISQSL